MKASFKLAGKIVCLVIALCCAGCTTIPISGPVASQSRVSEQDEGGVSIVPVPPAQGASPTMIVMGFLAAMASADPGYATARLYLSDSAAQTWDPTSQVLIYTDGTTPQVNGDQVTMSSTLVGSLRSDDSFIGSQDKAWNLDFGIVQENGEWRISNPPPGLALSQYMFSQLFTPIDAYFFPTAGKTLVPDPRYVQRGNWDRTMAARLVLAGPSDWLGAIVSDPWREGITLAGEVSVDDQQVADVPLSDTARQLTADQATELAIEIAATMGNMPGVSAVRLDCGGNPVALTGMGPSNTVPLSIVSNYNVQPGGVAESLATVQNGVVTMTGVASQPVTGDWGTTQRTIHSFAMQGQTGVAAVTDQGLLVGPIGDAAPTSPDLPPNTWLRPQYDTRGNIWLMSAGVSPVMSMITAQGVISINTAALGGMDIRGFQVAPDGRRIVLVRQLNLPTEGTWMEVGVALITYQGDSPATIVSYKPIQLTWESQAIKTIVDVAWTAPSAVLLLGSSGGGPPSLFSTDLDGLEMTDWGLPAAWNPVQMAVHVTTGGFQAAVLDSNGTVYTFQDDHQWTSLGSDASPVTATAIAYPV